MGALCGAFTCSPFLRQVGSVKELSRYYSSKKRKTIYLANGGGDFSFYSLCGTVCKF